MKTVLKKKKMLKLPSILPQEATEKDVPPRQETSQTKESHGTQKIRDPTQEKCKGNFLDDGQEIFKADSCAVTWRATSGRRAAFLRE